MQRYCVALVLPPPLAQRLDRARHLLQPTRRHMPAHITLVPPLALPDDDVPPASSLVGEVAARHEPIRIELRGCDTFVPQSSTAFLRLASGSESISEIADELDRAPLALRRRPVHPHVTIASRASRGLFDAALAAFADFSADAVLDTVVLFVLTDEGWRPISEGRMGGSRP